MDKRKYHQYTTIQHVFIKEAYTKEYYSLKDLTTEFNGLFDTDLTIGQLKGYINRYNLKNRLKRGLKPGQVHSGQFKPGNKPKPNSGQFAPGHVPHNKIKEIKK